MKKMSKEEILFKTVKNDNILPITSICKLNCIFCSHKNNPAQVETYSFGHLEIELIKTMIEFLNPKQPVFIGESASKIIEGEPFAHPEIYNILKYLRQRWPEIEIRITTSASFLEIAEIEFLKSLEPLELNISLNAPAPKERVFLMNDSRPDNVFKVIPELKKQQLDFSASIVSMHHLLGFDYLKRTFEFLAENPPLTLRVFMAGFSNYADKEIIADAAQYQSLNEFIKSQQDDFSYPIIIEPQLLENLKAEINNIMAYSPAASTKIKPGDIILTVEGEAVKSRTDAFYRVKAAKNPEIKLIRNGIKKTTIIKKEKNENSGLIMSYDLSTNEKNILEAQAAESKENKDGITVILASEAGYKLLNSVVKKYLVDNDKLKLLKVRNEFFGASIIAAGLLTNYDIIKSLNQVEEKIEKIILPEIIYDYYQNDLLGKHYTELEDKFKAEVILI